MDNYICINGEKIELSQETADNLKTKFSPSIAQKHGLEKYDGKMLEWGSSDSKVQFKHLDSHDYALIPLPSANDDWTYEAWDLAQRIAKKSDKFYPIHYSGDEYKNDCFIYIHLS